MKTISNSTAIKCKFSNEVHKILEPNLGVKRSQRWRVQQFKLTDAEKLAIYDKIVKLHNEVSEEYSNCLYKNRERKCIQKDRIARGYVAKKKTQKI